MRLQNIEISNYQGARSVAIRCEKAVTLVVGANGAGKSSIRDAIRHALGGDATRVSLKKDFAQLVSAGAKAGTVAVAFDTMTASLALPVGTIKGSGQPVANQAALAVCLAPETFAAMDGKARRAFLFDLMGVKISRAALKQKMLERGIAQIHIDQVAPMAENGFFDNAQKEAQGKARDAKASWRAITGEAYGSQKAEGWEAPEPAAMPPKPKDGALSELDEKLGSLQRELGALQQRHQDSTAYQSDRAACKDAAARLPRIEAKLATDREALAEFKPQVEALRAAAAGQVPHTLTCPECAALLEMKGGALHAHQPTKAPDMEAKAKLPEHEKALTLLENAVKNGERDLAAAQAAAERLKQPGIEAVDPEEIRKVRGQIEITQALRTTATAEATAYSKAFAELAAVDKKTAEAAKWHAEVAAWEAVAAAMAPDGIPAEFLAEAIQPFNADLDGEALASGWKPVQLDADMGIHYGGRAYGLLCESEKWRADAMLASVIAARAGISFIMLDRFDVLDGEGRGAALYWLDDLAANGLSALVLGTMKKLPEPLPENIAGLLIAAGKVANYEQEAA